MKWIFNISKQENLLFHLIDLCQDVEHDEENGYHFTQGPKTVSMIGVFVGIRSSGAVDKGERQHGQEEQIAHSLETVEKE